MSKPTWDHLHTIGFSVKTVHEDPDKITDEELYAAILDRLSALLRNPGEIQEACSDCLDSYEIEPDFRTS